MGLSEVLQRTRTLGVQANEMVARPLGPYFTTGLKPAAQTYILQSGSASVLIFVIFILFIGV